MTLSEAGKILCLTDETVLRKRAALEIVNLAEPESRPVWRVSRKSLDEYLNKKFLTLEKKARRQISILRSV